MIYVHGYYGYQNCGDEAFKVVFDKYLNGLTFVYTSPKSPPPEEPKDGDILILGGGNVIGEYFLKSLNRWRGKIWVIGVGLSSMEALDNLADLKPQVCYIRNKSELQIVKEKIPHAEYIPDLVLSLTNDELLESTVGLDADHSLEYGFARKDISKNAVIILSDRIISYLEQGSDFSSAVESISGLTKTIEFLTFLSKYYNLHFLAFSDNYYHPDAALNRLVAGFVPGSHDRVKFSSAASQPSLAYKIIKEANLVVSMKFHSLVFSLIANKSILNLSDAPKCLSLINDFSIDAFSCPVRIGYSVDDLKAALKNIEENGFNVTDSVEELRIVANTILLDTVKSFPKQV